MPVLIFSCKAEPQKKLRAEPTEVSRAASPRDGPRTPGHRESVMDVLEGQSIDLLGMLIDFCEAHAPLHASPANPTHAARTAADLSTEAVARHTLSLLSAHKGKSGRCRSAEVGWAAQSQTSVPCHFASQFHHLLKSHEQMIKRLLSRVTPPPKHGASTLCASSFHEGEGRAPLQRWWRAVVQPAQRLLPCDGARGVAGEAEPVSRYVAALSSNLYTSGCYCTAFLLNSQAAEARAASCVLCDTVPSPAEEVLPLFFYFVSLSLDLAAAFMASSALSPHEASRVRAVLQGEGSSLLERLLVMSSRMHRGGHSIVSAEVRRCCLAVTQHVLRRLQPLLFVPLPRLAEVRAGGVAGDDVAAAGESGGDGARCDATRVELLMWVAEALEQYASPPQPPPLSLLPGDRGAAAAEHVLSVSQRLQQVERDVVCTSLLLQLLQALHRQLLHVPCNAAAPCYTTPAPAAADAHAARGAMVADDCFCIRAREPRIHEYAGVLLPVLGGLCKNPNGAGCCPSPLCAAATEVEALLRRAQEL